MEAGTVGIDITIAPAGNGQGTATTAIANGAPIDGEMIEARDTGTPRPATTMKAKEKIDVERPVGLGRSRVTLGRLNPAVANTGMRSGVNRL
jgi:hypothetical protein